MAAIVIAVVVPLAALGVVISRGGSTSHSPARLPILAGGSAETATPGGASADVAVSPSGLVVFKAGPQMPKLDGSARAYKINRDGADEQLRRLTDILSVQDKVSSDHSAMMVGGLDGGSWSFNRQTDGAVTSSGTAVACPANADCPPPDTTIPQHPADLPSQDEAQKIAFELLNQAGIDTHDVKVTVDDYVTLWSVRIDPVVDGVTTEGFGTTVAVGPKGVIEYANGVLGRPEAADEYPLIGTDAAIDRLNKGEGFIGPRPMTAAQGVSGGGASFGTSGSEPGSIAPGEPAPLSPCDGTGAPTTLPCVDVTIETSPPAPPQEITLVDAEQILLFAPSFDGTPSWLVPGYRFRIDVAALRSVLAIDDSFLTPPPDQVPGPKGTVDPGGTVTIEPAPGTGPATKEPSTGG